MRPIATSVLLTLLPALTVFTGTTSAQSTTTTAPVDQPAGKVARALVGELVVSREGTITPLPATALAETKYVAFYYSAKWCPPCVAFTPSLIEAYREIKARHPEFELVFVSNDRTPEAMADYMKSYKMPFPAVRYDRIDALSTLKRPDHESGIPNLVFMDIDGRELSLSFEKNGDYRGPSAVLKDIKRKFTP